MGGLQTAVRKEYGVVLADFEEWDLHKTLDPVLGESWWKWMRSRDWLWSNFPALDGAIGGLRQLRREGHYLECVTAKPEWAEYSVWRWMGKWRPPFSRVTIVPVDAPKSEYTSASVLVDDKPANCFEFAASSQDRHALLFSRPHNRDAQGVHSRVYRADNWTHVVRHIELGSWHPIEKGLQ